MALPLPLSVKRQGADHDLYFLAHLENHWSKSSRWWFSVVLLWTTGWVLWYNSLTRIPEDFWGSLGWKPPSHFCGQGPQQTQKRNQGGKASRKASKLPSGTQTWPAGTFTSMIFSFKSPFAVFSYCHVWLSNGTVSGLVTTCLNKGLPISSPCPNKEPWLYHLYSPWPFGAMTNSQPPCHHYHCSGSHNAKRAVTKKRCHHSGCLLEVLICFDLLSIYLIHKC